MAVEQYFTNIAAIQSMWYDKNDSTKTMGAYVTIPQCRYMEYGEIDIAFMLKNI